MSKPTLPFKPIECRKIEKALKVLGFKEGPRKATSHVQWKKDGSPPKKVTFDCHRGMVSANNVISIRKQAGVTVEEFLEALNK